MKEGPRAKRMAEREAREKIDLACEEYVRERMKPELLRQARLASQNMKSESWGKRGES